MRKVILFMLFALVALTPVWAASPFEEKEVQATWGRGDAAVGYTAVVDVPAGAVLNVRAAPWGTIVSQVKDNTKLKVIGSSGDWYKIDQSGKTRYVHKDYVKKAATTTSWTGKVSSNGYNLNVRSSPWGSIVGSLKDNASVKVIGSSGDWYKISYNGKTCYVHKDYIKKATATTKPAAPKTKTAYVKTNGVPLNVRSGPWGAVVGSLANNAKITIVGESGDWHKISYKDKTRYVHKTYVSTSKPATSTPTPSTSTYKASVIGKPRGDGTVAGALTWARDQINGTKKGYNSNNGKISKDPYAWAGWCLAFVSTAYGRQKANMAAPSAIQSYYNYKRAGKIKTTRTPPAGAVMFTGTAPDNPYGHIFIATGKMAGPNNPMIITTTSYGIKEVPMSYLGTRQAYLGWAYP